MKKLFFSFAIFFSFLNSSAQNTDEAAVRKLLSLQQAAWNNGNIDDFMKGYWHNDSLMFIGKSGITYGWQTTLEHYKKGYPDTAAMGKLMFTLLEMKPLSQDYFFVVGKWQLKRTIGDVGGHFSLLFRKFGDQWFIVADHTS